MVLIPKYASGKLSAASITKAKAVSTGTAVTHVTDVYNSHCLVNLKNTSQNDSFGKEADFFWPGVERTR